MSEREDTRSWIKRMLEESAAIEKEQKKKGTGMVVAIIGDLDYELENDRISILKRVVKTKDKYMLDLLYKGTDFSGVEVYYNEGDANDVINEIAAHLRKDNISAEVRLLNIRDIRAKPHGGYEIDYGNGNIKTWDFKQNPRKSLGKSSHEKIDEKAFHQSYRDIGFSLGRKSTRVRPIGFRAGDKVTIMPITSYKIMDEYPHAAWTAVPVTATIMQDEAEKPESYDTYVVRDSKGKERVVLQSQIRLGTIRMNPSSRKGLAAMKRRNPDSSYFILGYDQTSGNFPFLVKNNFSKSYGLDGTYDLKDINECVFKTKGEAKRVVKYMYDSGWGEQYKFSVVGISDLYYDYRFHEKKGRGNVNLKSNPLKRKNANTGDYVVVVNDDIEGRTLLFAGVGSNDEFKFGVGSNNECKFTVDIKKAKRFDREDAIKTTRILSMKGYAAERYTYEEAEDIINYENRLNSNPKRKRKVKRNPSKNKKMYISVTSPDGPVALLKKPTAMAKKFSLVGFGDKLAFSTVSEEKGIDMLERVYEYFSDKGFSVDLVTL